MFFHPEAELSKNGFDVLGDLSRLAFNVLPDKAAGGRVCPNLAGEVVQVSELHGLGWSIGVVT